MSMVSFSDSERKILSGTIKVKLCCRSDHAFHFWVENACKDESEGVYHSARGKILHLLHDALGVGNSYTIFFIWHDMRHAKRAGDQIYFRSKIITAPIWVAICFVLEKCHDKWNLASILFETGFFFWRNSILPTFGLYFLPHAVSMQMVKKVQKFCFPLLT